jgi:uncharacterized membrane protein YfcA
MLWLFLVFILTGALAGLLSGLIGIGGGVVVVPCLYYIFTDLGMPSDEVMQIVLGTSVATISFNTFISSIGHYRKKGILLKPVLKMLPGLFVGAFLGATVANHIPSPGLKVLFGAFEIIIGIYSFFLGPEEIKDTNNLPKGPVMMIIGLMISGLSTLLGIGGGVLTVPMFLFFKVSMRKAVGTSSVTSFIISIIGVVCYLFYGLGKSTISMTIGYFYIPAFLAICGGSLIIAPLAVELAHRVPTQILKKIFACVLVAIGTIMLFK